MKCLLFIFTLTFLSLIDVQGKAAAETAEPYGAFHEEAPRVAEEQTAEQDDGTDSDKEVESFSSSEDAQYNDEKLSSKGKQNKDIDQETMKLFLAEMAAGEPSDLIGQNQHIEQSSVYHDLGRRSKAQELKNNVAVSEDYLTPEKAPPELVLLVAKESLLRPGQDDHLDNFDQNKILRSGDYWNGVWKEEVIPKSPLRSETQEKKLVSIKAKINPGTDFYKVVARMKKISPQLVYIINKPQV